ncbi:hypothetical protein BDW02DRAFT_629688 [Decorospora gaudefroyi]|uniref:Uncharacterized protein n=1 Tax=Decorospora gaudefroyi TaxID=184978 RepID=A0A6A5KGZ5_9PLEO|nr:hypothetical protein BDW02DRAFT_629688 [Decorospora gaudefroyi]
METASFGSIPKPRCCCGSDDCAFLLHNGRLLEGLERDVSKAAQLGQALLVRHEAYVADSERERKHMMTTIENLEREKMELEAKNAQTIKANRDLLDQLEQLNGSIVDSDTHIQALEDTLRSTEAELERLSSLAARTQLLERQLIDLEREQSQLQSSLDAKLVDERTAIQRWKTAERTIGDLQDQIDRIEKEAREERQRHVEVVARMERRMAVEGELNTAAGRLKAKAGHDKGGGTNVVSHFVKDILLDNANLQHGILELREMLGNSNEEVERLRDQLKVHQPVSPSLAEDVVSPTLQKELEMEQDASLNQELHIHHHYHGPKVARNVPKPPPQRRPKKKRFSLTPTHFDPPHALDRSSTATILNQTAVTVPNAHRWSQASTLAPGSFPGSPVSDSHRGSMYDRVFSEAYDSSRPTSPPDSIDLQSPMFGPVKSNDYSSDPDALPPMLRRSSGTLDVAKHNTSRHLRRKSRGLMPPSLSTVRSVSTPISLTTKSSPATAVISAVSPANSFTNDIFTLSPSLQPQAAIPEENEDSSLSTATPSALEASPEEFEPNDLVSPMTSMRPQLRRHASHESLISVSGMDIHTLQSRPSQLLYSSSPFTTPGNAGSVRPELTPWTATAHGTLSNKTSETSMLNRSLLYSSIANQKRGPRKSDGPQPSPPPTGITKKVGGWVFGKWGATPTPAPPTTTGTTRPPSSHSQQTQSSHGTANQAKDREDDSRKKKQQQQQADAAKPKLRPSGVNQNGPIWGFFDDVPDVPTKVVVRDYDADALGDALAG